jgi:hypothetical protein
MRSAQIVIGPILFAATLLGTSTAALPAERAALEAWGRQSLGFTPNAGETDPKVRYFARSGEAAFYFTPAEAVFVLAKGTTGVALHLTFVGAGAEPQLEGTGPSRGTTNYFVGDRSRWRTGVPSYAQVVYRNLWPGIDLAFRGDQGEIKYEFHVAPGADPRAIRLRYRGAERVTLDQGDLVLHTAFGVLRDNQPVSYQDIDGERVPVASDYALADGTHAFSIGGYDPDHPLVIDPGIVYSTYLGGNRNEFPFGMAVDAQGSVYVTGSALSANFPTTAGAFDRTYGGGVDDVFVSKLDPTGSTLVYSTYIGGNSQDRNSRIAVDAAGNAYITGLTQSTDFPVTAGAFDTTLSSTDGFVAKLDPTGSTLLYSTFLGGIATDSGTAIAVDAAGNAYVTGTTNSTNFPITPGVFDATGGDNVGDAFVTKLDPTGSTLVYSTFLGSGGSADTGVAIALDAAGNAYVAGLTGANAQGTSNFPTTAGAFDRTFNGDVFGGDGFVSKLDPQGATLVYSTFLGGNATDDLNDLALDDEGNAYITGATSSANFPTTPGAFQTIRSGTSDAFVTKLDAAGATLVYSTLLGGTSADGGNGIAVDASGHAHVAGTTSSADFSITSDAFDATYTNGEAFITKLDPSGATIRYASFLGGNRSDGGSTIAVDAEGNAFLAGFAFSPDFPTTPGAFQRTIGGIDFSDAFIAKFDLGSDPATATLTPADDVNPVGTTHTVTATVADAIGLPVEDVTVLFSVTGSVAVSDSCLSDAAGRCDLTYQGPTTPGADQIAAFADTNGNGVRDAGEPEATASKTWVAGAAASIALSPPAATNPVGTEHCVAASVVDAFGNVVQDELVLFSVTGSVAATGSGLTDANGQTDFCYTGPAAPGVDEITAHVDSNDNSAVDAGEPFATASKTWIAPETVDAHVTGAGLAPGAGGNRTLAFALLAKSSGAQVNAACLIADAAARVVIICRDASSIVRTGTRATIVGNAFLNGQPTGYRIDVEDLGDPGARRDTFTIQTQSGYVGGGVLILGNVQFR